jgi:hypothetical protein
MAKIVQVTVIDEVMRTTYDDDYFNEITIPKGYKIQVRIVKDSATKEIKHYKYAKCSATSKAVDPVMVYSVSEVTCKTCRIAIKKNSLLL